jgi:hypothetical protein
MCLPGRRRATLRARARCLGFRQRSPAGRRAINTARRGGFSVSQHGKVSVLCAERPSLPRDASTTETATPLSPSPASGARRRLGGRPSPPASTVATRSRSDGLRRAPDPGVSAAPRQGTQTGRHTPPARPGAPRTTCPSPEHSTPPRTADTSKETGPNRGPAHPPKPEESLKFAGERGRCPPPSLVTRQVWTGFPAQADCWPDRGGLGTRARVRGAAGRGRRVGLRLSPAEGPQWLRGPGRTAGPSRQGRDPARLAARVPGGIRRSCSPERRESATSSAAADMDRSRARDSRTAGHCWPHQRTDAPGEERRRTPTPPGR